MLLEKVDMITLLGWRRIDRERRIEPLLSAVARVATSGRGRSSWSPACRIHSQFGARSGMSEFPRHEPTSITSPGPCEIAQRFRRVEDRGMVGARGLLRSCWTPLAERTEGMQRGGLDEVRRFDELPNRRNTTPASSSSPTAGPVGPRRGLQRCRCPTWPSRVAISPSRSASASGSPSAPVADRKVRQIVGEPVELVGE